MPRLQFKRIGTTTAWASGGSISQELSPVPFPMSGMLVVCHTDISTTTATNFSDYWDRFLASLSLTGQANGENKTFFAYSNMRPAYHHSRFKLGRFAPRRPAVIPNSQTNALQQFAYLFHFGVRPMDAAGRYNSMDLTAAIPRTEKGQLTLSGTFGTTNAAGTNVTFNATSSCYIEIYVFGPQQLPGEPDILVTPQAFPVWSQVSITASGTSTTLATQYNVVSGDFLNGILYFGTNGTNAPRDRQILSDIRLYDQYNNRDIITFGGKAGTSDAGGGDYEVAELFTQLYLGAAPYSEYLGDGGGTSVPGTPSLSSVADRGLVWFPLSQLSSGVHPLYGADMRRLSTGDLRIDRGVNDATGTTEDLIYERYQLNPNHPANAAWL